MPDFSRHNQKAMLTVIVFLLALAAVLTARAEDPPANPTPNFAINFIVHVSEKKPLSPDVELQLRGANEVSSITSLLGDTRYREFRGDGKITQIGTDIVWRPGGLNASLHYEVVLPHERKPGVFDSFGRKTWAITRTADLFPRKRIEFRKSAKSYTTVSFDLPEGWSVVTAMPKIGENTYNAGSVSDSRFDWPVGWLMYGKIRTSVVTFHDVNITIAYPEAFITNRLASDAERRTQREKYLAWFNNKIANMDDIFRKVIPLMMDFMPSYAREFLIVIGKDPMWKGGLSGEYSLYINRGVPNIASDHTSTLVHEYFHVCSGFEKDERDAEWFVEGLAEYFSLRLLYEAKFFDRKGLEAGVEKLKSSGKWGVNLTRSFKENALYKNTPVILFALDEMIRAKTQNAKSLKNVVTLLSDETKPVNTKRFRELSENIYGESLEDFFKQYVYGGKIPKYRDYFRK